MRQAYGLLSLRFRTLLLIGVGLLVLFGALPAARFALTVQAAGTIAGAVFQDYNDNGVQDVGAVIPNDGMSFDPLAGNIVLPSDQGVGGVTVTAYDAAGAVVGTATTAADGTYSLNATGVGPYRVEFTKLPAGFESSPFGANSNTTVQFVPDGNSANVNLGINIPSDYCQDNPLLATSCYAFGDQLNPPGSARPVLVSFPYSAGSARTTGGDPVADFTAPTTHAIMIPGGQVGTTWGLAYQRTSRRLFAAAFMKRHVGFGPNGTGAIYQVDTTNNTASLYADLNAIFGAGTAGLDPHNTADYDADNGGGVSSWDTVGKTSLGGMAVSEDETKLYVMNLANRLLYELPLDAPPTAANSRFTNIPLNPPNCPATDDVRPFAVAVYRGPIYVGMVCSAESTQNANDLWAYVYSVDPATLTFSALPVFQVQLNYSRGLVDPGAPAVWQPWTNVFRTLVSLPNPAAIYPQPWLTDIVFDKGDMILGLRDRNGDQTGYFHRSNPASATLYKGITGGDFLRACGTSGTSWTLEDNARCGGRGAGPQNDGQGPGGGEYFFTDNYHPNNVPHNEVGMGSLVQVPGAPDVVGTIFDPIYLSANNHYDAGGVRWLDNGAGGYAKAYQLFEGGTSLGKANGLGDLVALCNAAPIEVGNRVWFDKNKNGIQDPDAAEFPIAGVTVNLYSPVGALLGTAVTDANGVYYFSSAAGTSTANRVYNIAGLTYNTAGFTVKLDNAADYLPGGPLYQYTVTQANAAGNTLDLRDSDGALPNPNAAASGANPPTTVVDTGRSGANNHTYDFGFYFDPTAISLASFTATRQGGAVELRWTTNAESNTWGFALYRSEDGTRAGALLITPQLILAHGRGQGATYAWTDTGASPEHAYSYWLQEVEQNGATNEYGPLVVAVDPSATRTTVYLPLVGP